MQLGMEKYLLLKHNDKKRFKRLMEINTEFCIRYANEMIKNGANAIVYFDPISSPTISTRAEFLEDALPIMKKCIAEINGPIAAHYASGIVLPIIDEIIESGVVAVGTSSKEDHVKLKEKCKGKITIIGNLNGIEMVDWDRKDIQQKVGDLIDICAKDGGLIISDNHGEIPIQVPEETIMELSKQINELSVYNK
jgi:uroporphyrinogen decarboxylase